MSTPMWDMPEHYPIDVDAAGNGPAEPPDAVRTVCWCGVPECVAWKGQEQDRDLARHIVNKQIRPQLMAEELRAQGVDVKVAFVSTDLEAPGFDVECSKCGRKARLPFDPAGKVCVCPNCMVRDLLP